MSKMTMAIIEPAASRVRDPKSGEASGWQNSSTSLSHEDKLSIASLSDHTEEEQQRIVKHFTPNLETLAGQVLSNYPLEKKSHPKLPHRRSG